MFAVTTDFTGTRNWSEEDNTGTLGWEDRMNLDT
jgi:hypothetical protein